MLPILTAIIESLLAYIPTNPIQIGGALLGTGVVFVYLAIQNDGHRSLFSYYVLLASLLMLAATYELTH